MEKEPPALQERQPDDEIVREEIEQADEAAAIREQIKFVNSARVIVARIRALNVH